jgi:hypothetical protein
MNGWSLASHMQYHFCHIKLRLATQTGSIINITLGVDYENSNPYYTSVGLHKQYIKLEWTTHTHTHTQSINIPYYTGVEPHKQHKYLIFTWGEAHKHY